MAELDITKVDKIYHSRKGDVHAVKALNLVVKPGEIVALLGSSGCGKTSTLRMIAGFEEVSNGSITLGGKPIHTLPPAARGVAMAFEAYSLYPPLTIGENMSFALKASKLPQAEQERRVKAMAEMLEIADILNKYPSSVSGGQQQRASLGRALVRDAGLYLLDEPMGQLEPQLRAVLRGRIKHYLREHRCTTILVTHDQTEANALADRIAVDPPYYSQRNFGCSTLEWCNLAAGRLDLYLHGGQMLWDYAAGSLILREAGGQVCTLDNDDFDAAEVWRRPVVAALDPTVFASWKAWLRAG